MRVKDLELDYKVLRQDGDFHLHSLTEHGQRSPIKYLCSVKKHSDTHFYVDSYEPTSKLSVLQEQIKNKIESYEYDSEYYNPCYRQGVFEELIIHDYLRSLGFEHVNDDTYTLGDKNIYGFNTAKITLSIWSLSAFNDVYKDGKPKDNVDVVLWTGDWSFVQVSCKRNVKDIKKGIDGLLKPLLITDSVNLITKSEKLQTVGDIDILMKRITSSLDIQKKDVKTYLKEQLLEIASKL